MIQFFRQKFDDWRELSSLLYWIRLVENYENSSDCVTISRLRQALMTARSNQLHAQWWKEERDSTRARLEKLKAAYLDKKKEVQRLSNENYRLKQRIAELQTIQDFADFEG